jgi:hypothetical protein
MRILARGRLSTTRFPSKPPGSAALPRGFLGPMFERVHREFRDQPRQSGGAREARQGLRGGARFFGPFYAA